MQMVFLLIEIEHSAIFRLSGSLTNLASALQRVIKRNFCLDWCSLCYHFGKKKKVVGCC